jgi:hypothetical protein
VAVLVRLETDHLRSVPSLGGGVDIIDFLCVWPDEFTWFSGAVASRLFTTYNTPLGLLASILGRLLAAGLAAQKFSGVSRKVAYAFWNGSR